MGNYLSILMIVCGLAAAVVVLLTAEPKVSKRLTAVAGVIALVGGLVVYGYGYIATAGSLFEALLHTVFAICRMFIGEADFGDVSDAPLFRQNWSVTLCWAVHVLAFYATSSAAISMIGANALRNLRLRLNRHQNLNIIYGVSQDSVDFGQELLEKEEGLAVYVAEDAEETLADALAEAGFALRAEPKAIRGDTAFLKSLGIRRGNRAITVYALHRDWLKNAQYAAAILESFEKLEVKPEQITLVIHAREEDTVKKLQVSKEAYGFGFVTVFQENGLAARLLTQKYPPCNTLTFDHQGLAQADFEAIVVGFGQMGQTVLRQLTMHGQFSGSEFRADVFAPDLQVVSGHFVNTYPGLLENFEIHFHEQDGRSRQMYDHLNARLDKIRYIAICTGSESLNDEIEGELRSFFLHRGKQVSIHQCSNRGIKTTDPVTGETVMHPIYHPDVLSSGKLDAMAMSINSYYMGQWSKGPLADWMECDYFSRMSSRAFADFLDGVLKAAGKTMEQALAGDWEFSPVHLENLSRMEHERWNAFHYSMGFTTMSPEEFRARADQHLREKAETGKGKTRIGKNLAGKTHACLVPWEALDELSQRENAITGGSVDYKQMDTNNILLVPELVKKR